MKKIILFILFCVVGFSQSYALDFGLYTDSEGVSYNIQDGEITMTNGSNITHILVPAGHMADAKYISFPGSTSFGTCFDLYNRCAVVYVLSSTNQIFSGTSITISSPTESTMYTGYVADWGNSSGLFYGPNSAGMYIIGTPTTSIGIDTTIARLQIIGPSHFPGITMAGQVTSKNELLVVSDPLICEIISQSTPVYTSIINIGSIEDITGTGADTTYQIGTGSYVRFFNISDLVGVDDLFYSSGSMTLKSSNAIFGEKPSIYIGSLSGLDSINISSDLGLVNIYGYNQSGELIFDLQKQSLSSTVFFPSKATYIILEFGKSFFTYTINSIDIRGKSIGIITKELCLDTETQEYTLDGEPYTQTSTGSLNTPTSTPSSEWSYTVSGYNFFENGFCLANFVPNPYGGKLRFEIVTPSGETQTTQDFGPYETDGFGYGFDSCVKVTTFFHENAGIYKVRVLYEYNGETVFPFGSDYNSYTISLPEVRANIGIDSVDNWSACGTDTGTFAGVTNFFDCLNKTVSRFFTSVYKNIQKIGDFITHMTNIFTTEVKTFSFIEKSYAFGEDFYVKPAGYDDLIFGKITNVFNLIVALCGIILSIGVIVYIKNNKND